MRTALGVQAVIAASDAGVAGALQDELRTVFPDLARLLAVLLPQSLRKSSRWIGEMEEIAADFTAVPAGPETFTAAARVFAAVTAAARPGSGPLPTMLHDFVRGLTPAPH